MTFIADDVLRKIAKYKRKDVLRVTGLSRYTFDTWLAKGIIVPSFPAKKRGHRSLYSSFDIARIKNISTLASAGVLLKHAVEICERAGSVYRDDVNPDYYVYVNLEKPFKYFTLPPDAPPPDWDEG